jgi:phage tail protein X
MRIFGIALAINMGSVAAVVCATLLALHGIAGWGWFLFVALLLSKSWTSMGDKEHAGDA